jgi:hypothetical protein
MEVIDFDAPTDAVAIPVETYTAARAYQIASEYRRRGIPVVMGGFHATLVPEEVSRHAEAVVTGEAEGVWRQVVDDLRHRTLKPRYHGEQRPLAEMRVDRRLFRDKRYLPIGLVETGRGCRFPCEFCAIQTFFGRTYRARPADAVIEELIGLKAEKRLFFFVDDNFAGDLKAGKPLLTELAKLDIRWITQMSINAAHDENFLAELQRAGCRGVLIGFESLNAENLKLMKKRFNTMSGGYRPGATEPAPSSHFRVRHVHLRLRARYGEFVRRGGAVCDRRAHVYRCLQPPYTLSRHAVVQAPGGRRAAALSRLVARCGLSVQPRFPLCRSL